LFPTKIASAWDRKLAAETISVGAVQEFFTNMHTFYLAHSCHPRHDGTAGNAGECGHVRMLTIGHSYGALLNFRSLVTRLAEGLSVNNDYHAYAYGDLTIMLNPAYEGARYDTAFYSAFERGNYLSSGTSMPWSGIQLPVLVTMQSLGDWATGDIFPVFRGTSTVFSNAQGKYETTENVEAAGWVKRFITHSMHVQGPDPSPTPRACSLASSIPPADLCDAEPTSTAQIHCRVGTWKATNYRDFQSGQLYFGNRVFTCPNAVADPEQPPFPVNFPLWTMTVDKTIMYDHDDIWNPAIDDAILKLYFAVVDQADENVRQATRLGIH